MLELLSEVARVRNRKDVEVAKRGSYVTKMKLALKKIVHMLSSDGGHWVQHGQLSAKVLWH